MSFGKAVDLLRLAMMAASRRGVCLMDVEEEFGGVRRTAQRMIAALQEAFPATEHYVADDGHHFWRLPGRAVAPLLTPSAEELVAVTVAIEELERIDMADDNYGKQDPYRSGSALVSLANTREVWLPGLSVDHRMLRDLLAFAGVHRGFSPAGADASTRPESSTNYEAGLRWNSARR